ncbi:hypothetical protein ACNFH5_30100 [Pseudomonas sp. NY15435]|uniref:hypothetical protein n=1 Tax=Pseudomonas sp. NY15435 TaxID=3400358 RepID=UPI003A866333
MNEITNQPQAIDSSQQPIEPQVNTYVIPTTHWIKIYVSMNQHEENGTITQRAASAIPYVWVKESDDQEGAWIIISTGTTGQSVTHTPPATLLTLKINGPGRYRAYIKEPSFNDEIGDPYEIPFHALSTAIDSEHAVQPWLAVSVTTDASAENHTIIQQHPNDLNRNVLEYPPAGSQQNLTQIHTQQNSALNLGDYIITRQLWSDASRAYGAHHQLISNSAFREILEEIYQEQLPESPQHALTASIENGTRTIIFDPQSTNGGRSTRSFLPNNGQPSMMMTAGETLRRTYPRTLELLLELMEELNIHYARSTGAWRPHFGSSLHRYAASLDITHLRTRVTTQTGGEVEVTIHFHRNTDPDSNPIGNPPATSVSSIRKRDFSLAVHTYLAEHKMAGDLGWLGGPWQLTYNQVGLLGSTIFIKTDEVHKHHLHMSAP